MADRICINCGVACKPRAYKRKMCSACYQRFVHHGKPTPGRLTGLDAFWAKVDFNGPGGCWLWLGQVPESGYGQFGDGRYFNTRLAHRIAYLSTRPEFGDDLVLDHLCRVRHCVNPNHLEPVTQQENILRGIGVAAQNAAKTTCSNGHPFDIKRPENKRGCRICATERTRRWRQRQCISA